MKLYTDKNKPEVEALKHTTHMGIGAHPDDLEIFAFHGIQEGLQTRSYTGITVCDGAGSPRTGAYAKVTDQEMVQIREQEQIQAAQLGKYAAQYCLRLASTDVKKPKCEDLVNRLISILKNTKLQILYTHNPMDKHQTHVAVSWHVVQALRALPVENLPQQVIGCEVWRDLDWLTDKSKVMLDVSSQAELAASLINVHKSQIEGGKKYAEATLGRRMANAVFSEAHSVDMATHMIVGVDLMPLIINKKMTLSEFALSHIKAFETSVLSITNLYQEKL